MIFKVLLLQYRVCGVGDQFSPEVEVLERAVVHRVWREYASPLVECFALFFCSVLRVRRCHATSCDVMQVKAPSKREAVFGKFAYSHNFLPRMVEHDLKVNGTKTE